jgi:hypothetical protein
MRYRDLGALNLVVATDFPVGRMLDDAGPNHVQIDVHQAARQMVTGLHGGRVVAVFPEGADATATPIESLSRAALDSIQGPRRSVGSTLSSARPDFATGGLVDLAPELIEVVVSARGQGDQLGDGVRQCIDHSNRVGHQIGDVSAGTVGSARDADWPAAVAQHGTSISTGRIQPHR